MTRRRPPAVDLERIALPDGQAPGIEHGRFVIEVGIHPAQGGDR